MLRAARKRASIACTVLPFFLLSARAASLGAGAMQSAATSTMADQSSAASSPTTTTTSTATQQQQQTQPPPPPPPPPAYASPGPCGVSAPIRGVVEASNTGDLLKTTLILPTRDDGDNSSSSSSWGTLPQAAAAAAAAASSSSSLPFLSEKLSTSAADAAAPRCSPPYPLVAFFSGFQARSSSYDAYARHLASWGFAVVRYDTRLLSITADRDELRWLADVVRWAISEAPRGTLQSPSFASSSSFFVPQPDILLTAGHSRGAKLAALQYAGSLEAQRCFGKANAGADADVVVDAIDEQTNLPLQPLRVSSAFLIDPVDNTRFTPASPAYPSAAAALKAQGGRASLAVAAAGKIGACNPADSGYQHFWPSIVGGGGGGGGGGSGGDSSNSPLLPPPFLLVFKGASHATFNDAGGLGNKLADWLCGGADARGPAAATREGTIGDTGAAMVSWFDGVVSAVRAARAAAAAAAGSGDIGGVGVVSVSLEAGDGVGDDVGGGGGGENVRVFINSNSNRHHPLRLPASPGAAVPSPSEEALQRDFYAWAGAAAAAGQVEFEARPFPPFPPTTTTPTPPTPPTSCPPPSSSSKASAAVASP